jgi:transcriptional regulator with XRE-family HTH domain
VDVEVGQRLRHRRIAAGLTQEDLANGVGLTFQQIQKYEKGANRISASKLQQFADILKTDVAWFFEGASGSQRSRGAFEPADWLKAFMELPEAHSLMKGFVSIRDKTLRRQIARLAERLADVGS